jgi:hypothetical protein
MPDITEPGGLIARLAWFFGIAAASALAVAVAAEGLRFLILH